MGTDNLFHKRKARSAQSLQRRKARREAYQKLLIVCEGEKTEPNYEKGRSRVFTELLGQLERAKSYAENSLSSSIQNNTDNPSTRVHHLISALQQLKE